MGYFKNGKAIFLQKSTEHHAVKSDFGIKTKKTVSDEADGFRARRMNWRSVYVLFTYSSID